MDNLRDRQNRWIKCQKWSDLQINERMESWIHQLNDGIDRKRNFYGEIDCEIDTLNMAGLSWSVTELKHSWMDSLKKEVDG